MAELVFNGVYYLHDVSDPVAKNEIQCFSDASEVAYGFTKILVSRPSKTAISAI